MRLRRKPWIDIAIHEFDEFVFPKDYNFNKYEKGMWQKIFNNNLPITLELGIGKGRFLTELSKKNPKRNFIGIEKSQDILYQAAKKIQDEQIFNVKLMVYDINDLELIFAKGDINEIYLNFSDPWPKKRHAKRRLTHRKFLKKYKKILQPGGKIFFKTDNSDLFEFSLLEFQEEGFQIEKLSYDIYTDVFTDNIETEYEIKFSHLGAKIKACQVICP